MTKANLQFKGRTVPLRNYLSSFFKELGINAYYQEAEPKAAYPYIVYGLRHIGGLLDDDRAKRYVMEVNAYTNRGTAELENLLDCLEDHLDSFQGGTAEFNLSTYLAYGRLHIEETSPLKRIRINFEIKYYPKGMC